MNPTFLLELSDILLAKVATDVKINVISESASQVISYANINLESLNPKLQDKIYYTESPLSFDKMIKAGRLEIFESLSKYLKKPKSQGFAREMFLCSNETLRLGVAPYMIQHL